MASVGGRSGGARLSRCWIEVGGVLDVHQWTGRGSIKFDGPVVDPPHLGCGSLVKCGVANVRSRYWISKRPFVRHGSSLSGIKERVGE